MSSNKVLQIRSGKGTDAFREWVANQGEDINEKARKALEHFIVLYGTADIESTEVKVRMYQDFLTMQGYHVEGQTQSVFVPQTELVTVEQKNSDIVANQDNEETVQIPEVSTVQLTSAEEETNKTGGKEKETDIPKTKDVTEKKSKPVRNRGQIAVKTAKK